eukprot:m.98613 g.98613  ORF g.98613 m.98613 type:complete len:582 (+) comp15088_c0_seq1:111-1856(+)
MAEANHQPPAQTQSALVLPSTAASQAQPQTASFDSALPPLVSHPEDMQESITVVDDQLPTSDPELSQGRSSKGMLQSVHGDVHEQAGHIHDDDDDDVEHEGGGSNGEAHGVENVSMDPKDNLFGDYGSEDDADLWQSAAIVTIVDACDACLQAACPTTGKTTLVQCCACGIQVHPGCYGLTPSMLALQLSINLPHPSPPPSPNSDQIASSDPASRPSKPQLWFCDPCARDIPTPCCCACPMLGGPLKETTSPGVWCHVSCANLHPSLLIEDAVAAGPVILNYAATAAWGQANCSICVAPKDKRFGLSVTCIKPNCDRQAHGSCALRAGCLHVQKDRHAPLEFLCHDHSPSNLSKANRLTYQARIHARLQQPPPSSTPEMELLRALAMQQRGASLDVWLQRHPRVVLDSARLQQQLLDMSTDAAAIRTAVEHETNLNHQLVDSIHTLRDREEIAAAECKQAHIIQSRCSKAAKRLQAQLASQSTLLQAASEEQKVIERRFYQLASVFDQLGLALPPPQAVIKLPNTTTTTNDNDDDDDDDGSDDGEANHNAPTTMDADEVSEEESDDDDGGPEDPDVDEDYI